MASLAQLQQEVVWRAEYPPPSLVLLGSRVRSHFGLPQVAIGTKGDEDHLAGYHRSYAWILGSRWCTNRLYSVTETPGNRQPGDRNWICALDITAPAAVLLPMCQRLDRAVRAGVLEKVVEWYGNKDGDSRVDGYDNIRNALATSDPSHLWHLHLSFDRGLAGDDHDDVYRVLAGLEEATDMDEKQAKQLTVVHDLVLWNVHPWVRDAIGMLGDLKAAAAADATRDQITNAALTALAAAAAEGGLDAAPIMALIREEAERSRTEAARLLSQLQAKDEQLARQAAETAQVEAELAALKAHLASLLASILPPPSAAVAALEGGS